MCVCARACLCVCILYMHTCIVCKMGGGGYSTVLPTAEVIPPRRPPPSKPESGGKSATVGALGTSKTRTRHLRVRMRAGGQWADTQWLYCINCRLLGDGSGYDLFSVA
ncbi:hypothetical protein Hanom_Chr04g00370681 [Helianthus anomalus]